MMIPGPLEDNNRFKEDRMMIPGPLEDTMGNYSSLTGIAAIRSELNFLYFHIFLATVFV